MNYEKLINNMKNKIFIILHIYYFINIIYSCGQGCLRCNTIDK